MLQTFIVTSVLFVGALVLRYIELVRGRRFAEDVRTRLDTWSVKTASRASGRVRWAVEYLHRDVLLRGLHMLMYITLMFVRGVERRLVRMTDFIRSFRKKKAPRSTSERLSKIRRGDDTP